MKKTELLELLENSIENGFQRYFIVETLIESIEAVNESFTNEYYNELNLIYYFGKCDFYLDFVLDNDTHELYGVYLMQPESIESGEYLPYIKLYQKEFSL